jgi:AcrR family transcriptional regulator
MEEPEELGASGTRERILEAALDLFSEQGFDKTSLRQVAERVGVTKAGLYYHFPSKEDLLSSLVERGHGIGHHGLDLLPPSGELLDMAAVSQAVERLLDQVLAQRRLFAMMERNRTAIEALGQDDPAHAEQHRQLEERWSHFVADQSVSLRDRVRVAAAMGAVMAGAIGTTRGLGTEDPSKLRDEVADAIHDLLGRPPLAESRTN